MTKHLHEKTAKNPIFCVGRVNIGICFGADYRIESKATTHYLAGDRGRDIGARSYRRRVDLLVRHLQDEAERERERERETNDRERETYERDREIKSERERERDSKQ